MNIDDLIVFKGQKSASGSGSFMQTRLQSFEDFTRAEGSAHSCGCLARVLSHLLVLWASPERPLTTWELASSRVIDPAEKGTEPRTEATMSLIF